MHSGVRLQQQHATRSLSCTMSGHLIYNNNLWDPSGAQAPPAPAAVKAQEEDEDLPPWVRREREKKLAAQQPQGGLPWPLLLILSLFVAIASVSCSVFAILVCCARAGIHATACGNQAHYCCLCHCTCTPAMDVTAHRYWK
jgi:hypothetical protein